MPLSAAKTPSVNLTKYVKLGDGKWRYCAVVISSNGRIKSDMVLVDGKPERHPEGTYCIDWYEGKERKRRPVGKNAVDAHNEQQKQQQLLAAKALGIAVHEEKKKDKLTLEDAVSDFLEETRQQRKDATYRQYDVALRYFQESCGKHKKLCDIGRKDLIEFMGYLREEKKLSRRTIWTKVNVPVQLLNLHGITGLMKKRDWPTYVEREPEIYTADEIEIFRAACSEWEQVVFDFFLMTGFREAEVQHVTWKDIDFKQWVVRVTAKRDFTPKTWEEREVPMVEPLAAALQRHKKTADSTCPLVFSSSNGQICYHFLEACKAIALRAKLNCGNCDNGKNICAISPTCENWFLHKFRATYATMHLQSGVDLRTVQSWMGHKDLASTMRYLKPSRGKGAQERANLTFAPIGAEKEGGPRLVEAI